MTDLRTYVTSLMYNSVVIDQDLKKIIQNDLRNKFDLKIKIKNLKFVETASHVMFFNSRKINSLYNAPLNAKIFSYINNSNISLSFSASKIKLNNPSSPQYLDFFGELFRILPANKYKNSYVYCLEKINPDQIKKIEVCLNLYCKKYIVKNLEDYKESDLLKNKGCINNIIFLNKCIKRNANEAIAINRQILFRKKIYKNILLDMLSSFNNPNHLNLADQVNYVQSNLINNIFVGKIEHYYLSLEDIGAKLFLIKLKNKDSFIEKLFFEYDINKKISIFFKEPFFLRKKGMSLIPINNNEIIKKNIENLIEEMENGKIILNTKFNLFVLSIYGLQVFGGRFQKEYMFEYVKIFLDFLQKNFEKSDEGVKLICNKIKKIKFFDIASMIIAKSNKDKFFCDYNTLLLNKHKLDNELPKICKQNINDIYKDTHDYLNKRG